MRARATRRPRAWATLVTVGVAAFALPSESARAGEPVPAVPPEQSKPASSPYLLSGDRFLEANVAASLQLDWNGVASQVGPTAHAGVVLGGEVGVPFVDQRVRPALFTGIKLGAWADETHGPFGFVEGARFRWSPLMWDVFDVYLVARGDFDLDPGASAVFRPGAGLGVRVARMLAVEATWDVTVPLGSPFAGTRYPSLVPFGISFGALFDACFGCNRSPPPQASRDLACQLYRAAANLKPANHKAICDALPVAMTAYPDPLQASREQDGAGTFLQELAKAVPGDDAKSEIRGLVALHQSLLSDWSAYERQAAAAAERGRRLGERWTYAPVPGEIRAFFGCDVVDPTHGPPPAAPTCQELPK
jgi:hypothetical protein